MSPPVRRISRVLIASVFGTVAGLWALRIPEIPDPPPEVAVTEVAPDPSMADLRLRITLNGKRGFVDGSGQTVIAPTFQMAMPFSEGMAAVSDGIGPDGFAQWRFVNASGVVLFTHKFQTPQIGMFHEGMALIADHGKFGFINARGDFVVPMKYDGADSFSCGLASVKAGPKYGIINRDGTIVLPPKYDFIGRFSDGRALFSEGKRLGYLDERGTVIVPATFENASDFSEGLAFVGVSQAGQQVGGYIDLTGKLVIPFKPSIMGGPFRQGLAAIQEKQVAYFIDRDGNAVIKPEGAEQLGNFSEDLAPAKVDGQFGFVDRTGKMVIPPQWQFVEDFKLGVARVNSGDVRGYINKQGKYIWKLQL